MIATALRRTGSSAFNPLTAITWHSVYWAGDPGWSNPGDGNTLTTWRDGSGNGRDATVLGSAPVFRSSVAAYNGQPCVDFYPSTARNMYGPTISLTGSKSMVVIGNLRTAAVGYLVADNADANPRLGANGATNWVYFASDSNVQTGVDTNPHLLIGWNETSASKLVVDGAVSTYNFMSAQTLSRFQLNGFFSGDGPGRYIAFAGIYQGDITADAQYAAFKTWVASTYGLTIV